MVMAVVMVIYDFEQRMPLYIFILINKHCQVFIVISITAWVNVRPPVLSKTEIHTDKKLGQELSACTSHTNMHIGANMNDL